MIRFELILLPVKEGASPSEAKVISSSNEVAEHSYLHLKKLIGHRKCRKHPSSANRLRISAVKGGEPEVELVAYCCPDFVKILK